MKDAHGKVLLATIIVGACVLSALGLGCGAGTGSMVEDAASRGTGGASQPGAGGSSQPGAGGASQPSDAGSDAGVPRGTGGASQAGTGGTSSGAGGRLSSGTGGSSGAAGRGVGGSSGAGGLRNSGTGGSSSSGIGGAAFSGVGGVGGAMVFACAAPVPAPALLTDFSPATWMNTNGKWGMTGFLGIKYSYTSPAMGDAGMSTASATVDIAPAAQNLSFIAMVQPGGYAGFGLLFDQCGTVAAYNAIQFTLSGTTGGCDLQLQLETFEQRPKDQTPPGGCDRAGGASCSSYPAAFNLPTPPTSTAVITVEVPFATLSNWNATLAAEIVAVQWQLTSPGPSCSVNLRIDDVAFVSQ